MQLMKGKAKQTENNVASIYRTGLIIKFFLS